MNWRPGCMDILRIKITAEVHPVWQFKNPRLRKSEDSQNVRGSRELYMNSLFSGCIFLHIGTGNNRTCNYVEAEECRGGDSQILGSENLNIYRVSFVRNVHAGTVYTFRAGTTARRRARTQWRVPKDPWSPLIAIYHRGRPWSRDYRKKIEQNDVSRP